MNILLLMIPLALVLLVAAVWAFVWAVRRGQFEDLDTPAIDILREDETERATRARVQARRQAAEEAAQDGAGTPREGAGDTGDDTRRDRSAD